MVAKIIELGFAKMPEGVTRQYWSLHPTERQQRVVRIERFSSNTDSPMERPYGVNIHVDTFAATGRDEQILESRYLLTVTCTEDCVRTWKLFASYYAATGRLELQQIRRDELKGFILDDIKSLIETMDSEHQMTELSMRG